MVADVGGDIRGYNLFSYCFNNPVNMEDPSGHWPTWAKVLTIVAVAAVIVAAVAIAVATCGAGSVAGVAMITGALTIAAKATEVAVLQAKKSSSTGNKSSKSSSGNSSGGGNGSSGGGSSGSGKKSGGRIETDVIDAVFDNGLKIIGFTPLIKAGTTSGLYVVTDIAKHKVVPLGFNTFLQSAGGKVLPYGFAALNWGQTTISIFSDDPVQRAEQRGYKLK